MYKVPNIFDGMFYYTHSEGESCPIVLSMDLSFAIDPERLQRALNTALRRYPNFRVQPLLTKNGFLRYIEGEGTVLVCPFERTSRCFGTEDMNGYLFRVMYEDNHLEISAYHALADARGMLQFARTILYYYMEDWGRPLQDTENILTLETPVHPTEGGDMDFLNRVHVAAPSFQLKPLDMFLMPGDYYPMDTEMHSHMYRFVMDTKPLLDMAHQSSSSLLCVLSVMIAKAVRALYDPGKKIITMQGVIDMRPYYDNLTLSNFADVFLIPFTETMLQRDTLTQANVMKKALLEPVLRRENVDNLMLGAKQFREEMECEPLSDGSKLRKFRKRLSDTPQFIPTFFVSNIGSSQMSGEMEAFVDDVHMFVPAVSKAPFISVLSHRGRTDVTMLLRNESDLFARQLLKTFRAEGLETEYKDCGNYTGDKMYISRLKRLF